jgi:PAS domain S-box-containing protein
MRGKKIAQDAQMEDTPIRTQAENTVHNPCKKDDLRRRAEDALLEKPATNVNLSGEEVEHLIHELQVHQIELEMQNEELRQTQEELETARQLYFDLFNQAPVGYLRLSNKGIILTANLAAASLLGIDPKRLESTSLTDYIFREDQDIYYLGVQRARQENRSQEFELRMVTPSGGLLDVSMLCASVEEQGQVTGPMRVTLSDISGRKQQERALKTYAHRLEILNKDLEEFSSLVSHDLKEPLHKIKGFGNILLKDHRTQLDQNGCDYLERMQNAASRMDKLIEALLALSRLSTQTTTFQHVDLNTIAQEALCDLEGRLKHTEGQVEIGNLPTLAAEPTLMRQLFLNLLGNALKYHKPGLPPVVRVDATSAANGWVEIRFADNGIGFNQEAVAKLFKPFARLHGKSQYEGTGIGLAICRKIAENHGGTITACSAAGQGATFIVTLPIQQFGRVDA